MLSAIAARKAAQAAKQQEEQPTSREDVRKEVSRMPSLTYELEPSSPGNLVTSDSEAATPRKRKAKIRDTHRNMPQKRMKRLTNADIGRTRYFEAEQPIEGFEDEDDDILQSQMPRSRGYSPSQPAQDSGPEDGVVSRFISEDPGPSRGYSPSRPVLDSSEEDGSGSGQENVHPESRRKHSETSYGLSRRIFVPEVDINCFRLTSDDLKKLDVPNAADIVSCTLILLPPGHSFTFVGATCITLLQGAITILGTPLRPSLRSHRVFSPRSSPLASIEALETSRIEGEANYLIHSKWKSLPRQILNAINASDSVLIICPLVSGVEGLGKVCRTFDGVFDVVPDVRETEAEDAIGVEGFHPVNLSSRPHSQLQQFLMPESWDKSLDSVVPSISTSNDLTSFSEKRTFVALMKGPKKCGKSTFARTLLNRLTARYRRVAFLECDLGQSEFTPGGMIALHVITRPVFGPPFTHPAIPYRAHYVGHSTPRSSPSHYLACIEALIHTYRMDVQYAYQDTWTDDDVSDEDVQDSQPKEDDNLLDTFVPLVVNTQGWVKGLGGDLLRKIEEIVEATDVFDLEAQTAAFPRQRNQRIHPSNTQLHIIRPILSSPLAAYYTPADHRSLSMLSYFHSIFPSSGREVKAWSTELPLCARAPWEVDCKEAIKRFVLVGAGFEDVIPEELEHALNCGIVALVCDEDHAMETDSGDSSWPYMQGAPAPLPDTSHCAGLALIRGVNAATQTLHILTPVPPASFSKCHVLVKGELELPVLGMLDYREGPGDGVAGVKWGNVPYLQMGRDEPGAIGGARRRVRKNLMRRGQIA